MVTGLLDSPLAKDVLASVRPKGAIGAVSESNYIRTIGRFLKRLLREHISDM